MPRGVERLTRWVQEAWYPVCLRELRSCLLRGSAGVASRSWRTGKESLGRNLNGTLGHAARSSKGLIRWRPPPHLGVVHEANA